MNHLPKDIKVEIEFLTEYSGGRNKSCFNGYRPQFFYQGQDWDAVHQYIGKEEVKPGEKTEAYLTFLSPDQHYGKVYIGMPFLIREGNRAVGFGSVLEIIDLPRSAQEGKGTT